MRSLVLLSVSSLPLLAGAAPALALGIDPNPFSVDHGGVEGSVELVDVVIGLPSGGSVGIGVVPPTAITLVFSVSITETSLPAGGLWLRVSDGGVAVPAAATGWIPGSDVDIAIFGSSGGWSSFVPDSGAAGTQLDRIFLSYAGPLAENGSLAVEAGLLSSPSVGGAAQLVPEPTTALLLGLGLLALSTARALRA